MSGNTMYMVPNREQSVKADGAVRSEMDRQIGVRIRLLREELGLSTRDFSRGITGLRSSNLSEIERGVRRASSGVLAGIQRKYGASVDYLLTGQVARDREVGRIRARAVPVLEEDMAWSYLFKDDAPSLATPPSDEFAPAVTDDPRAIAIKATGPLGIRGVDTIFVEPGREITDGDVVVVKNFDHPPEICRFQKIANGEVLLVNYADPARKPIVLSAREAKSTAMYRVTGLFKRL